jgi:hypothetical protein
MRLSTIIVIICFILSGMVSALPAQTTGFVGIQGIYDITDDTGSIGMRGNLDYRTLIDPDMYLHAAFSGEGEIDLNFTNTSDRLLMQVDSTWFLADDELYAAVTAEGSIGGNEDSSSYLFPDWDITYRKFFGYRAINPFVSYRGSSTQESIVNGIKVGFIHAPKVELSYTVGISGDVDTYFASGETDVLASLDLQLSQLIGLKGNWITYGSFTYRTSQDNTREGISGVLRSEFTYAPTRRLQVHVSPAGYWEYLTQLSQWNISGEIALRTDIEMTPWLFGYLSSSIAVSADALWDVTVTIGSDIAWGSW